MGVLGSQLTYVPGSQPWKPFSGIGPELSTTPCWDADDPRPGLSVLHDGRLCEDRSETEVLTSLVRDPMCRSLNSGAIGRPNRAAGRGGCAPPGRTVKAGRNANRLCFTSRDGGQPAQRALLQPRSSLALE